MNLSSKRISGPKIEVFLSIYPFLKEIYDKNQFCVEDAILRINRNTKLGVWCHKSNKYDRDKKAKAEKSGFIILDLQNACHCFAGRGESKVIDKKTGKKYQLLDQIKRMTYCIK